MTHEKEFEAHGYLLRSVCVRQEDGITGKIRELYLSLIEPMRSRIDQKKLKLFLPLQRVKNLVLLLFCLFISVQSHAEAEKFTATVSSNNVAVGDQIQITFLQLLKWRKFFRPPSFNDFNVLVVQARVTRYKLSMEVSPKLFLSRVFR